MARLTRSVALLLLALASLTGCAGTSVGYSPAVLCDISPDSDCEIYRDRR